MSRLSGAGLYKFLALIVILGGASGLPCQNAPAAAAPAYTPRLTFDVASIRESGDGKMSYIDNVPGSSVFLAERVPAAGFILGAYDIKLMSLLKNVPQWATTTPYTVAAKSDDATDVALSKLSKADFDAEKRHMLQALLAERFKLQIHAEIKVSTTYELVATDRAAKLMTQVPGDGGKTIATCNMHFSSKGVEVDSKGCPFWLFVSNLQQMMQTNVLDRTGMSGTFAYHLMWDPKPPSPETNEERYPQLVDAVREQLGLELKQTKGQVTFWVVDHIERPTVN